MGKYLFRKLTFNVWVTAIVVLQLALALVLFSHSLSVNSNYTMSVSQVENIYGDVNLCRMRDKSDEATLIHSTAGEDDVTERQHELYTWLKSNTLFTFMSYQEYEINFYDRIPNGENFLYSYDGPDNAWMKAFRADEQFMEMYPVALAEGRSFQHTDFVKAETLPVILGNHYQGLYSVGDIIEVPSNSFQPATTLTVIGIAKANSYIACPNRSEGALLLDDYILYPYLLPDETTAFAEYDMLIFQSIIIPNDYDAARVAIKEKSRALGLYEIELTKPVNKSQNYADIVNMNGGFAWITTTAVISFALITIISALIYRYGLHKVDYGKFLLCGATKSSLATEFTLEMLILLLASNALALMIYRNMGTIDMRLMLAFDIGISFVVYVLTFTALRKNGIVGLLNEEGHHD